MTETLPRENPSWRIHDLSKENGNWGIWTADLRTTILSVDLQGLQAMNSLVWLDSYYVGNSFNTHEYISKQTKVLHYPSPPSL